MMRTWQSKRHDHYNTAESKIKKSLKKEIDDATKRRRKPKLSMADVVFLTSNTKLNEVEIRKRFRKFVKECPDGCLYRRQMLEMCGKLFPGDSGDAEEYVRQMFRIFDKDGNGVIDFREFMLATDMIATEDPEEKLRWAFRIYDMDNSGSIDSDEMEEAISTLYAMEGIPDAQGLAKKKAGKLFSALGVAGPGELTMDDFVTGCLKDKELLELLTGPSSPAAMASSPKTK